MRDVLLQDLWFHRVDEVQIEEVAVDSECVRVRARAVAVRVGCPGCGMLSSRVHSRYVRRLADNAVGGRPVVIELQVRRFRCGELACPRATFAEQISGLTFRHGRRSTGLHSVLQQLALMLAGRAGSRLASVLDVRASRSTLLRLIRRLAEPKTRTPRVLGVDEFALRKVIYSRPEGVLHVVHEFVGLGVLRGGRGYLPPSSTQNSGREHAGSACRVADDAAGIVDGLG